MPRKGKGSKKVKTVQELMANDLPKARPDYGAPELQAFVMQFLRQGWDFNQIERELKNLTGQVIVKDSNDRVLWLYSDYSGKVSQNLCINKTLLAPVAQPGSSARLKPERPLVQFQPGAPKRSKRARLAILFGVAPNIAERRYPVGD